MKRTKLFARIFLVIGLFVVLGFSLNGIFDQVTGAGAATETAALNNKKMFSVEPAKSEPARIEGNHSPWLNMRQGKSLESTYVGDGSAIQRLEAGTLLPLTMTSGDFNFDGYADLISGFADRSGGGILTFHKANKEAFAPQDEAVLAGIKRGEFPVSFEKEAEVIALPVTPDFIVSGRFSKSSTLDIVVGSRSSSSIYIISANSKGGFDQPREIAVGGEISALAAGTLDESKGFSGIAAATRTNSGFELVLFDGNEDLYSGKMQKIPVASEITSLVLASPDGTTTSKDLFLLGGGEIGRISNIGRSLSAPVKISLPFRVQDFALGEFVRDRRAKAEIAVLSENGDVSYLQNGTLDTRPFTEKEMRAEFAKHGRGRTTVVNAVDDGSSFANNWTISETQNLGIFEFNRQNSQSYLQKSYITGNETEDLIVMNPGENRIRILFKEPNTGKERSSFTGETKIENVAFAAAPAAALPIRLNVMGQQGIAVLENGKLEPTPVMFVPNATFTVSKTNDTNDGLCNADCSVREAFVASNGAAGADMIVFSPNGTHLLTIGAGGENSAAQGDLDVTESLTIVGNGSANTLLQAGTNTSNGIDKVISINPNFTTAFATSITGVTVRYGRNPSSFATDGFGGGFDWEGTGTGTLSVTNSSVLDNRTLDGDGGGITVTNSSPGSGAFTANGSTISDNIPARIPGGASPFGGAVFVGTATPFFLTNTVLNNNAVTGSGGQGQGGAIFAFGPGGAGGNSFLTGSTVSNNSAPSDGGGIYTTQRIDVNPTAIFSNNSSGRFGGALFVNHGSATSTINKASFVTNNATTTGGAIFLGSSTTANVLNLSFSRIASNTAGTLSGLATSGGTANVENNWWGCATGPSAAPCDTAGISGGGAVDFDPWLQLRTTASPGTVVTGQTSSLTSSFLLNSAGSSISASNLNVLIGLTVSWSASGGSISSAQTTIQSNGQATATFTATNAGPPTRSATAQVDNGPASANITVNKADTALSALTDSPDPSVVGQSYTVGFTLGVVSPGGGTPTGTVGVSDGTGGTCTATLPATSCSLTSTSAGSKTLTFSYSGDSNYNASPGATSSHTVNKANTTITGLTDSPDPTVVGESYSVGFTLNVTSPGAGTPTGTVSINDGTGGSCTATLPSTSCNITSTTAGSKTISATYNGDTNFNSSPAATTAHTVNKADTTLTALTDSPDPTVVGQAYSAGFTLNVTSPGAGTPTGTVSVSDGTGGTCTATLPATSCSLTSTSPGAKTISFTYNGDANFNSSPAATTSHTVNKADTTVSGITDSPDPSVVGQAYSVGFTLNITSPGAGTPTGTVSVSDGTGGTCTATLPSTSCNVTSTSAGSKTLSVTYNGDGNFNASPAATTAHTVDKADTSVTILTHTPDPSIENTAVSVTYSVTVDTPGAGTPTGTVTVSDGVDSCMASVAAGGCSITLTTIGSRTLTATYSGDANFNTDVSPGVSHQVNSACTTDPVVANSLDSGAGSFRQAVVDACPGSTITFAGTVTSPISLSGGQIVIDKNLTITGPMGGLTIQNTATSSATSRVFGINSGITAAISGLSITGGNTFSSGGGIYNSGNLTLSNSTVRNNQATNGGGIFNEGDLTLINSTVSNNTVFLDGGGIYNTAVVTGNLTLVNSTVSGNTAGSVPPVVTESPDIDARSEALSGGAGGGIYTNGGTFALTNSTVTGNSGVSGLGGGLYIGSPATLTNSIVANSDSGGDCVRVTANTDASYSLIEDGLTCVNGTNSNNLTGDPGLGALADNGGPAFTHALLAGSSALDKGSAVVGMTTDQRGFVRPVDFPGIANAPGGNGSDIGAFELSDTIAPTVSSIADDVSGGPVTVGDVVNYTITFDENVFNVDAADFDNLGTAAVSIGTPNVAGSIVTLAVTTTGTGTLQLRIPTGATIDDLAGNPLAVPVSDDTTITVNGLPSISIDDVSQAEGDSGTTTFGFTVSLSQISTQTVSVDYQTANGTATAGSDYNSTNGTLTFAPGEVSKPVNVTVNGDTTTEIDEDFFVNLAMPTNATILDGQGLGTIENDDIPTLSIDNVSQAEGNSGTSNFVFTVSLSQISPQTVTVDYQTADGSATTANNDYNAASGTLTFNPGDQTKTVSVSVVGDIQFELDETFFVNLSNPNNATISDSQGLGTIQNDDTQSLSIADVRITEGNSGTSTATFTVTLAQDNAPLGGPPPASATVDYQTVNGTATSGSDYVATSGTLTFLPGQTEKTVSVTVNGDVSKEPNETFFINLSNAVNANIADGQAAGVIIDEDRAYTSDFDNDKIADYTVYRPGTNVWYILQSTNSIPKILTFGAAGDIVTPGDYDADGVADYAVFRPSDATWYIIQSSNSAVISIPFGQSTDKPVQGDFDGDGKTDAAVYRPSSGTWNIRQSSNGQTLTVQFGISTDLPVQGDYDGDGKTDLAVFRDGIWYILRSSNGSVLIVSWGLAGDQPVPGDFDGDGKTDLAIFRNGIWWITNSLAGDYYALSWGLTDDVTAVADYDGDGTSDVAVFRPSDGIWYIHKSSDGNITGVKWGISGDVPIPHAYLPQ